MELLQTVKYLFDRDCEEEMTEDEEDALQKVADDLVAEYGWNEVFSEADKYLRQFCISPESVINFAVLFWDYRWYETLFRILISFWHTFITELIGRWAHMMSGTFLTVFVSASCQRRVFRMRICV